MEKVAPATFVVNYVYKKLTLRRKIDNCLDMPSLVNMLDCKTI